MRSHSHTTAGRRLWPAAWLALAGLLPALNAEASCDLFPTTERTYAAALGTTNRPFAAPGETLELRRRACDTAGRAPSAIVGQNLVTIAFLDAVASGGSLVVVADDCDAALATSVDACTLEKGVDAAACVATDELEVLGDGSLRFPFPATAALFGGEGLAGPARIAVTRRGDALPCALAQRDCHEVSGADICIGEFYEDSGACDTGTGAELFTHFTALPRPNEFSAACFREEALCAASEPMLRLVADSEGNLFLPVDWAGVLAEQAEFPIPRLVRAAIDSPIPFDIPDEAFAASFTEDGGRLPPIFTPLFEDAPAGDPDKVVFFGSADAPYTVLRFARRFGVCTGGSDAGELCEDDTGCGGAGALCELACVEDPGTLCRRDSDCASGACGELFDASAFLGSGTLLEVSRPGPGVCQLPPHASCTADSGCPAAGDACVSWALEAGDAVPLDGILETDELWAFTFDETIDGIDRNGDNDAIDTVVTRRSRQSGAVEEFASPKDCGSGLPDLLEGRATMRLAGTGFDFIAVQARGAHVAFLEPESDIGGGCDLDDNGDTNGVVLSMAALGEENGDVHSSEAAADTELLVDGDGFALGDGVAFARFSEAETSADLNGDGDEADTVLGYVESSAGFIASCAAGAVASDGRAAAFLRPESADAAGSLCPAGSLNSDGDQADSVVALLEVDGGGAARVENLGLAASAVDLSAGWVAALAPEADEPLAGNGDGDTLDRIAFVRERAAGAGWTSLGLAGDRIHLDDDVLLVRVPEGEHGGADLDDDGSSDDDVLHALRASGGVASAVVLGAADDFVLGTDDVTCAGSDRSVRPLAFARPFDADEDGSEDEFEMRFFNAAQIGGGFESASVHASGMTVHPCDQWACDPRQPFHVDGSEVRFLTDEATQGADLDGDGDQGDIVLQIFDLCSGRTRSVGAIDEEALAYRNPLRSRPSIVAGEVLVQTTGRCVRPAPFCGGAEDCACPKGSALALHDDEWVCVQAAPASCSVDADCGKTTETAASCVQKRVAITVDASDVDGDGVIDSADSCDATGLTGACVDGLLCRRVREIDRDKKLKALRVVDALGASEVAPKALDVACRAVGLGGSTVNETQRFASRWKIAGAPFDKLPGVRAKDRFGVHELLVKRPTRLMLEAFEGNQPPEHPARGYQCYGVREIRPEARRHELTLAGGETPVARKATYNLGRLKSLCLAAEVGPGAESPQTSDAAALLCYRSKPADRTSLRPWSVKATGFTDRFGEHVVQVGKEREVCVRAVLSRTSVGLAARGASAQR